MLFSDRVRFRPVALLRLLCVFAVQALSALASGELGEWTWRSPLPTGATLRSVAANGTLIVAVGDLGAILTSPDGVTWTERRSGRTDALFSVVWGAGLFAAVGDSGAILTSPDGVSWTRRYSGKPESTLEDVTWAGGQFVAVGGHGTIVTSPDGVNWTIGDSETAASRLRGVAGVGSWFVAVGDEIPAASISDDGKLWYPLHSQEPYRFNDVAWLGGQFVAVGIPDTMRSPEDKPVVYRSAIRTSPDGFEWKNHVFDLLTPLEDVTWNGSRFVAVGDGGVIYTSENGDIWIKSSSAESNNLCGVTWTGHQFVAVGEFGTILTSLNGVTWTRVGATMTTYLVGVIWGGGQWLAIGLDGTILTSPDGANWTRRTSEVPDVGFGRAIAWNGSQFVAVGWSSTIKTSPDGVTWTLHPSDIDHWFNSLTWNGQQFVAVGWLGGISTSPDGVIWQRRIDPGESLVGITWGGNQFVAVGAAGIILTSPDGVDWTRRFAGTTNALHSVAWSGHRFVVVGDHQYNSFEATILTSPDGVTWTRRTTDAYTLNSVTWAGDQFVAVGAGGAILQSPDGVNWMRRNAGANPLWNVAWNGRELVVVGANGSILTARPLPLGPSITRQPQSANAVISTSATFTVTALGTSPVNHQWRVNGTRIPGATDSRFTIADVHLSDVGIYDVVASDAAGITTSAAALLGVSSSVKVIGDGVEIDDDIMHPNGNVLDQVLLTGPTEAITADWSLKQVSRTSFIDLDGDIVQVEFSGPGTLSLVLDGVSGPARPANYNQAVEYVKGHASLVITGADERTNISVFTVGRATAFDPTGAYNLLLPPGAANDPAKNGSPLFQGHAATKYGGVADLAFIAISSRNGKFGGVRAANAHFFADKGLTGLYAPGVVFQGPVYVGDITAFDTATPVLVTGLVGDARVTGGDLCQDNGAAVQVAGIARLKFLGGETSHGIPLAARSNGAFLEQNGTDVTAQIVVNPVP